jgi:hypothetical protein
MTLDATRSADDESMRVPRFEPTVCALLRV